MHIRFALPAGILKKMKTVMTMEQLAALTETVLIIGGTWFRMGTTIRF